MKDMYFVKVALNENTFSTGRGINCFFLYIPVFYTFRRTPALRDWGSCLHAEILCRSPRSERWRIGGALLIQVATRGQGDGVSGKAQKMHIVSHKMMTESGEELSVPFNGRINYCGLSVAVKLKINLSCPHGGFPINVPGTVNKTVMDVYFILSNITLSHKHVRVSAQESILQSCSMFAPICPISISESTYFRHNRIGLEWIFSFLSSTNSFKCAFSF